LAIILEEALANPVRLRTMGQMSLAIVEREATLERMGDGFVSAFSEIWSWTGRRRSSSGTPAGAIVS